MDKRTVIALALSALVIILFQTLYFAPHERETARKLQAERERIEKAREDSLALASAPDTLGAGPGPGIGAAAPESDKVAATGPAGADVAGARTGSAPGGEQQKAGAVSPADAVPVAMVGGFTSYFAGASPAPPREIKVETDLYEATFSTRGGVLNSMKLRQFMAVGDSLVDLVRAREKGELSLLLSSGRGRIDLAGVDFAVTDSVDEATGRISKLRFEATDQSGASVAKTFTFKEKSYTIGLDIELRGAPSQMEQADCLIGWTGGIPLTDANVKEELRNVATVSLLGTEMFRDDLNSFKKTALKEHTGNVKWTGVKTRYFIAAFIPLEGSVSKVLSFGDPGKDFSGSQIVIPVSGGGITRTSVTLYLGPIDLWQLKDLKVGLERVVNLGWSWIRPISQLVLWFLLKCYNLVPNYGLVIILLSALTKVLFHPLTKSSMKSMRNMQRLQPEIQKLKEKFKGEPQKLNKEVMALYKREKINPLGGCLPILVQLPVFIALYNVLMSSIEMRRAHFVWWINDLSSPDTVAVVAGFA
ncbi:MAG: membrane protein insertase YidC, partial [Candidatus Eisenbacteria bacterium]|nr:membrane protein insertase YidC [Candidatus Eisenbacteria bacterium]